MSLDKANVMRGGIVLLGFLLVFGWGIAVGKYEAFPFRLLRRAEYEAGKAIEALKEMGKAGSSPAVAAGTRGAGAGSGAFSSAALKALPRNNWPTNGGNLFNQRYSPLSAINRSNVGSLKAVWRTQMDGSGLDQKYSGSAQPVVHEGVIYMVTGANDVFAISVATGHILWKYKAVLDEKNVRACCSWTSRGVGLGAGKVYLGQLDGKMVALDQKTGRLIWSVQAERAQEGYSITSAPLFYEGLVVTGFAGADLATRGRVRAFNAEDGSLVWTFFTIPAPGDPGSETWPSDNDAWKFGGGAVWQTPAVDPELGLLYFQTANPNPDFRGQRRRGDNLFTNSVVALDAITGEYRWHYQTIHHDLWDYDSANPVVLFDAEIDGRQRLGLAAAGKTGWVYILDRTNGEPLIGIEEKAVPQEPLQETAATQPHPIGDPFVPQHIDVGLRGIPLVNHGRIFTPFWTEPRAVKPGTLGGANWPPSSYDPETQTLYVCAVDQPSYFIAAQEADTSFLPGDTRLGGTNRNPTAPAPQGVFAAIDLKTNRLVWDQHWNDICYSGSVATAGGLVFVGRNDGRFVALDSSDGSLAWEFQTGAGVNAPASVFEYEGKQYVVVHSGGSVFARSKRGDSVWLFSLDGALGPVDPLRDDRTATDSESSALLSEPGRPADVVLGQKLYANNCTFCHGDQGQGGHSGPPLKAEKHHLSILQIVRDGRDQMPAFGGVLSQDQIRDIALYVASELPH